MNEKLEKRLGPASAEPKPVWWNVDFKADALVEASAGTGKTYTLENLVLRLVCVEKMDPRELLLVTFTEKAAGELKDRITGILKEVEPTRSDFDEMTICTIHSFCREILAAYPFESGLQMVTEVAQSDRELMGKAVQTVMTRSGFQTAYATTLVNKLTEWKRDGRIDKLKATVVDLLQDCSNVGPSLGKAQMVQRAWESLRVFVDGWKSKHGGGELGQYMLSRVTFSSRQAAKSGYFASLDGWLKTALDATKTDEERAKVLTCIAEEGLMFVIDRNSNPEDIAGKKCSECFPEFVELQNLAEAIADKLRRTLADELAEKAWDVYQALKRRSRAVTFDDMVSETGRVVADAAEHPEDAVKKAFLQTIRSRYRIALVDEFQDTDARQWTIFDKLFSSQVNTVEGARREQGCLIVVGDPKQAIYSFRGADVATYLAAKKAIRERGGAILPLKVMYRSTEQMVEAFNTIFKAEDWFTNMKAGDERIGYDEDVEFPKAGKAKADVKDFVYPVGEHAVALLESWPDRSPTTDRIQCLNLFMENAAAEMVRLHGAQDGWPVALKWEDICVLVRSKLEAQLVRRVLSAHDIPCRQYKEAGLFDSPEAESVLALLDYLIRPNAGNLAALLLTPFFNVPLSRLEQGDETFDALRARWQKRVQDRNWIGLFESAMNDTQLGVRPQDGWADFLRTRAAVRQIFDRLLESCSQARNLADFADTLRMWARNDESAGEAGSVRELESEADAVQIMTMHASKGLEFGAVFIPWGFGKIVSSVLEPELTDRFLAKIEMRRVLYVALTRAKYKLYLPWSSRAQFNEGFGCGDSALNGGFLQKGIEALSRLWKDLSVKGVSTGVVAASGAATEPTVVPAPQALPPARGMKGWRFQWDSFSSLNHHAAKKQPLGGQIFTSLVPKGALSGTVFHEVMEVLCGNPGTQEAPGFEIGQLDDFETLVKEEGDQLSPLLQIVRKRMSANGLRGKTRADGETTARTFARMAWNALRTPITIGDDTFMLCEVAGDARKAELGFALAENLLLGEGPRDGALNGSIDLLIRRRDGYYILDWKTNALKDYKPETVEEEMEAAGYHLQYGFYTLAAEKWLGERTVKGVAYLFVRGGESGDSPAGLYAKVIADQDRADYKDKFARRVDAKDQSEAENEEEEGL